MKMVDFLFLMTVFYTLIVLSVDISGLWVYIPVFRVYTSMALVAPTPF